MLLSGEFGATESPSAALVGLNRGPLALVFLGVRRRRAHSGTMGALSDVSWIGRLPLFFEPMVTLIVMASRCLGVGAGETSVR
jgi:hypothetical protein